MAKKTKSTKSTAVAKSTPKTCKELVEYLGSINLDLDDATALIPAEYGQKLTDQICRKLSNTVKSLQSVHGFVSAVDEKQKKLADRVATKRQKIQARLDKLAKDRAKLEAELAKSGA